MNYKLKGVGTVVRAVAAAFIIVVCSAPAAGNNNPPCQDTLSFFVIGDWGKQGNAQQRRVAAAMDALAAETRVDFIVTTGDNFYPKGVASTKDQLWEKTYENVYALPHLRNLPWYVSLGNHDYMGDIQAQIDYSRVNSRWNLPGTYYSQDFATCDFGAQLFFLDTNVFIEYYRSRPDKYHHIAEEDPRWQIDWLGNVLAVSDAGWKIVFGHHPVYSSGRTHGTNEELKALLSPVFRRFGVHAYFAGHDHHLEHYGSPDGTHYFISGGGGAKPRSIQPVAGSRFVADSAGFAHVRLTREAMRVAFIDKKGDKLYEVEIPAPNSEEE